MFAYFIACIANLTGIKENEFFSLLKFTGYLVPFWSLFSFKCH